jgi:hypothetical protein
VKRLSDQTLYEILEVPHDAAPPDIEAAYERARSLYAPGSLATYTLMTSEEAALLTSRIEEARRTLLDAGARDHYDAALAARKGDRVPTNGDSGSLPHPFAALPPVIPAVRPPADEAPAPAPVALAPADPPAPIAVAGSANGAAPVAPSPPPIRLEREIPAPPAEPAAAPRATEPAPEPAAEIPLPEGALWTGEALRRVREARGLTVQQIAERTKVTRHHVENIEAERYSSLPAPVYLRGILLAVARELRLDGQKVARAYLDRAGAAAQGGRGR